MEYEPKHSRVGEPSKTVKSFGIPFCNIGAEPLNKMLHCMEVPEAITAPSFKYDMLKFSYQLHMINPA